MEKKKHETKEEEEEKRSRKFNSSERTNERKRLELLCVCVTCVRWDKRMDGIDRKFAEFVCVRGSSCRRSHTMERRAHTGPTFPMPHTHTQLLPYFLLPLVLHPIFFFFLFLFRLGVGLRDREILGDT